MNQPPTPTPGTYADSCGTRYLARLDKRSGWWLHKQPAPGRPAAEPFQCPGFVENVARQIFTLIP